MVAAERDWLEEFEELYQQAPIGLCVVDRDLRYTRANDEYAKIVGQLPDELIGKAMAEVIPVAARGDAIRAAAQVIETGKPVRDVELRRAPDGDAARGPIWLVNIQPLHREGQVVGAMAVLQNITLVRRAEEQARERLSELESIYRNAPVGLSFVDRELRYLRVNQAVADLNGISCEEMVGKRYRDLSPENADTAEPFLLGLMRSGTSVRNLETVARPPADPDVDHHFLLSMDPVRLADGEVVGHTAAVQDVTELRRIEAAAAQRLAELEILYANTPAGLCYVDTDLRIIHVNALFAQLSPVPPNALIGAPVAEVLPQQLEQQLLPQLGYALRSGASSANLTIRGRVPGSGEREYTWIAHTHPTRGSDETVTGLVTVLQDITPLADRQRELEADARRLVEGQQIAQVGSFEWDLIEDGVWWSPEMYAISGRTQALSYVGFFEVVHPDDRDKVRAQVDRTLSDGDPARLTFRILHPDGSQREIFGISRVDRNAEGIPARMVGTWQDVTQFGKP